MSQGKRIRRGEKGWRKLFSRQANSGMSALEFCQRRGVNIALFRRWQARLGESSGDACETALAKRAAPSTAPFIDLGDLHSSGARLEVRLDLGDGMILSIARS